MSKRPNEEQITKEIYTHHDGDEEADVSKMGDFHKASSDALARRPMKALRRIGSLARTISDVDDDGGTKRTVLSNENSPSPPGSRPEPRSSNQPSESRPPVPELAKSFSAPASSSTTINPATSTRPNLFSQASFTFNIGSSVTLPSGSLIPTNPVDMDSPKINEEGYEKALRGVNTTFMKKIQKELELNAIINLAHTFQQYIDHRIAIKKQFQGIAEPKPIVLSKDSEARTLSENDVRVKRSEGFRAKNDDRSSSAPTSSSSGPQARASSGSTSTTSGNPVRKLDFGFGLPLNKIASAETIKPGQGLGGGSSSSAPGGLGNGSFGFGSSSIKGVVDPSRNPAGSVALGGGWSIGVGSPLDIDGSQTNFQRHGGAPSTPSIRSASFPGPSDSSMLSPMAASSLRAAAMSSRALGSPRPMTSNMRLFSTAGGLSTTLSSTTSSLTPSENQPKFSFKPPAHRQPPKTTPFVLGIGGPNSEGSAAMARAFARVPSQETLIAGAKKLQFNPATEAGLGFGGGGGGGGGSGGGLSGLGGGPPGSLPLAPIKVEDDEEEGEQTVFEMRAKLFVLDKDEYRDQGIGQFRVREDMQSRKRRMMMRTDSTGLVSLNSWIIHPRSSSPPTTTQDGVVVEAQQQQQLVPRQDKKSVIFFAMEENRPKQFLLRVKTEQDAAELLKALL
ncbi:hypothetical protein BG005_007297 [Podila minutissima]|nr:hypothetical protein BG005_007297 [Podila minutissima]